MRLAVRYLAVRDRTGAQVRQWLLRKGASSDQVEQTVSRLSDLRYLNDRAYAERWIASRLAGRPIGYERLRAELQAKGVDDSIAVETIREAFQATDEDMLARLALDSVQRRGRRLTAIQSVRFLRQRGFGEETISRMMGDRIGNEGSVHDTEHAGT